MTDIQRDTALQAICDRYEIEALSHVFARALDGGTLADFLSIFSEDVYYQSGARVLVGHAALADFFKTREAGGRVSRHMMSGLDIAFDGPDHASGRSVWLTFAGVGALPIQNCNPFQVADIEDRYLRTKDGWCITRRVISSVFRNPDIAAPVKEPPQAPRP